MERGRGGGGGVKAQRSAKGNIVLYRVGGRGLFGGGGRRRKGAGGRGL